MKLLGLLALPGHLYITSRVKSKRRALESTVSFVKRPILWIHEVSEPRKNFWGFHEFLILNFVSLIILLPNEIALLPALFNMVLLFIITLGYPLWKPLSDRAGKPDCILLSSRVENAGHSTTFFCLESDGILAPPVSSPTCSCLSFDSGWSCSCSLSL